MMKLHLRWSNGHQLDYEGVSWKRCNVKVSSISGDVVFQQDNVEAPDSWSDSAIEIAASKYFRHAGVLEGGAETSVRQLIDRVSEAISSSGALQGYFDSSMQLQFCRELKAILVGQVAAFNSPVWFNCGLFQAYGLSNGQPNWMWSDEKQQCILTKNAYAHPQTSACFIQSVKDDLLSIFDLAKREAQLFRFGSGTGTNFSPIRSRYEEVSSGGNASGLIPFLEILDKGAAATKSGGTTRRAAKMVVVDADHPEIEEFIFWKRNEERKAKALIREGFSGGFEGESYRTVSGQNSNNSVRVTDAFMEAVKARRPWSLLRRTDRGLVRQVQAATLWKEISLAAWECADPGLQFHDTIQLSHTCPESGPITASNPCSEYMFLDDSACNLASINLVKFFDESSGYYDFDGLRATVNTMIIAQDILVDFSSYPSQLIAKNSHDFRPLGLGFSNLGGLLMRMGVPYDSSKGRAWAFTLMSVIHAQALLTSVDLAKKMEVFNGYNSNRDPYLKTVQTQRRTFSQLVRDGALHKQVLFDPEELPGDGVRLATQLWNQVINKGSENGFRNAQLTAIAPTGTISFLMDCDTMGIEPDFSLVKYKTLAGGGHMKIINKSIPVALRMMGYKAEQIDSIEKYVVANNTVEDAPFLRKEDYSIFACAYSKRESRNVISSIGHLLMMAAVQPMLSGAISKTVNLPFDATVDEIAEIYFRAWELKLKSISIYRDESKGTQPLLFEMNKILQERGCLVCS